MARSNCMGFASNTPGTAKGVSLQHKHTAGKFISTNSDTTDATKNPSRPEHKVSFSS